jgi:hypothetical protein
LNLGEKEPEIYSAVAHVTDGIYHVIKIVRRAGIIEFYVDSIRMKLNEGNSKPSRNLLRIDDVECSLLEYAYAAETRPFPAQRRLRIGSFQNVSQWNGILAGRWKGIGKLNLIVSFSSRLVTESSIDIRQSWQYSLTIG